MSDQRNITCLILGHDERAYSEDVWYASKCFRCGCQMSSYGYEEDDIPFSLDLTGLYWSAVWHVQNVLFWHCYRCGTLVLKPLRRFHHGCQSVIDDDEIPF